MKTGKVCSKFAQNFARFKKETKSITGAKNLVNFYGLIGIATWNPSKYVFQTASVYWLSKSIYSYVNKKAYFSVEYKHQEVYNNNRPRKIVQTYDLSKVNDVRGSIFIYLTMGGREGRRHNGVKSQNLYAIAFQYV